MSRPPLTITGSFLQPWLDQYRGDLTTEAWWREEIQTMQTMGMDHVVLQFSLYREDGQPSQVFFQASRPFQGALQAEDGASPCCINLLSPALMAAHGCGMEVWVGLAYHDGWSRRLSPSAEGEAWRNRELSLYQALLDDLCDQFGHEPAFRGWYIPIEVNNVNYSDDPDGWALLSESYGNLVNAIRERDPLRPILFSPFANQNSGSSPQNWHLRLAELLKAMSEANANGGPLVLAFQDGIGTQDAPEEKSHCDLSNICDWLAAIRQALQTQSGPFSLWANVETFRTHFVDGVSERRSAQWLEISEQIAAQSPYVEKITCFSYNFYHGPQTRHAWAHQRGSGWGEVREA